MMMDERTSRIFFGLCMLVLVWIGVYWTWQPSRELEPAITFGTAPEPDPTPDQAQDEPKDARNPQTGAQPPQNDPPPPQPQQKIIQIPTQDQPRLIPPQFTEHIVQPNELMQHIAKAYYGSIDDWVVIAKANPRVDPRKLKPGMVLRIPTDKNNIQGVLEGVDAQPGVITSHTPTQSKVIEYVVRPGDSLSVISQRIYGSSRHARFIFESNRDVLRSMDAISVGQLLRLPPLPDEDPAEDNETSPDP